MVPTPLLASLLVLLAAGWYVALCALAPFGPCGRCHHRDPLCRHCDGTGRRVRLGRRAWTYLRRLYDDAH